MELLQWLSIYALTAGFVLLSWIVVKHIGRHAEAFEMRIMEYSEPKDSFDIVRSDGDAGGQYGDDR